MKKLLYNLALSFVLCAGVACGNENQNRDDEGEIPVSAEDPRAPTVAPDKPTTDIGAGLEDDTLQQRDEAADNL